MNKHSMSGNLPDPDLPEDSEARRELARQFAGLIQEYATDGERAFRSIASALSQLQELLK